MSAVMRASWLLAMTWFLLPAGANATRIDLSPTVTTTTVGSLFTVDVVISGLSATSPALAVTDFDLDISYNSTLLQAAGIGFGSGLGTPPAFFGSDLTAPGIVDLFAVSIANYATLRAAQGDSFTLATLTFLALAPGTDSLAFVRNVSFFVGMINASGQDPVNTADPVRCQSLNCIDVGGSRVVIGQRSTVAEPDPWTLIGIAGLAGLAFTRRTQSANRQAASAA